MAAVGRHTHERLGHEARERARFAADLPADLAVGRQPVGGELGPIEVEVQLELSGGVLVVALDHVEAHRLAVLDHLVDDRLELAELVDVVAERLGHPVQDRLAVGAGLQPHHLRLAADSHVQAEILFELGVDALQVAAAVGAEELPRARPPPPDRGTACRTHGRPWSPTASDRTCPARGCRRARGLPVRSRCSHRGGR